ncbi:type IV secretory system conjugative DNA transfer family protein [Streptomyces buecherae]|uniref:type IV secretory system conjugative DNA transfer family protein n=1 Tax=Streptomyces buecherae TaxID=2763006 RepID=UPI001C2704C8|nr:type IV secretory system conjugative DNA transfer family protein [Streptomyces buecherae]
MADPRRDRAPERGIPDGLLIGALLFLIGLALLTWTATGLAGLLAHGAWPENVSFIRTPQAARHLVQDPGDLAAAWPHTPKEELSGYGLFWGLFISEVLVLLVVAVFVVGTVARYRLMRARRAADRRQAAEERARAPHPRQPQDTAPSTSPAGPVEAVPAPEPYAAPAAPAAQPAAMPDPQPPIDPAAYFTAIFPTPQPAPAQPAAPAAAQPAGASGHAQEAAPQPPPSPAPTPAPAPGASPEAAPAAPTAFGTHASPPYGPATPGGVPAQRDGAWPGAEPPSRVRYGTAAERQDAALHAILEAAGPTLVTSGDATLWAETTGTRAKLGPVHVFDPSHLLDTPARLRWNPASGCEAREVAAARAVALLAPVRPASLIDSATADAAETLLRCWLHAAAVDGRPFRQVHRWAQGHSAHEPVRILRTNPKATSGMAGELESTLTAHPERRDMAQELTARALAALSSIHIRDACNASRADALALESFVGEGGTLYVVGESLENPRTQPGAMPLLTALVASVVEHAQQTAKRSPGGRLDPPLTLVLDDIAGVAPFPALPELMTSGPAQGLEALALMRSPEQARARWPRTHGNLVG